MLAGDMGFTALDYTLESVEIWVLTFYEPIVTVLTPCFLVSDGFENFSVFYLPIKEKRVYLRKPQNSICYVYR